MAGGSNQDPAVGPPPILRPDRLSPPGTAQAAPLIGRHNPLSTKAKQQLNLKLATTFGTFWLCVAGPGSSLKMAAGLAGSAELISPPFKSLKFYSSEVNIGTIVEEF